MRRVIQAGMADSRDIARSAQSERQMQSLRVGDYDSFFRLSLAATRGDPESAWSSRPYPRWNSPELKGAGVLIVGEQGFGDQIMYARFGKLLQDHGADVTWLVPTPLVRLFSHCLGGRVQSMDAPCNFENLSFCFASNELPLLFFPQLAAPPSAPYLAPPKPNIIPGNRIGVVTQGNPGLAWDNHRTLPPELASELLAIPGAVSLHPEDTGARDFFDTATIIAGLDLVVSVDTSVAHLAGAMGKPVWILISTAWMDWRWTRHRDHPWYASARVLYQPTPGDWRSVVDRVKADLS